MHKLSCTHRKLQNDTMHACSHSTKQLYVIWFLKKRISRFSRTTIHRTCFWQIIQTLKLKKNPVLICNRGTWLIRCFYLLSKSFPPPTIRFWLSLRRNGQMEDIQYLYNDGIPFGQEELHTRTHRPHVLAKGLSLQMSWVIFHYPGSEESSV